MVEEGFGFKRRQGWQMSVLYPGVFCEIVRGEEGEEEFDYAPEVATVAQSDVH